MADYDMSLPRRRLTQDLNSPSRINILSNSQKRMQEKRANPTRGVAYDPLDFVDTSFEMAPTRRRTIQLNEIMHQGAEDQETTRRRPPTTNYSDRAYEYTSDRGNWDDKERQYIREKMYMEERIEKYKAQLDNMIVEYEKLKNIRSTDQETALADQVEWAQVKDEAYITLRDQVEEFLSHNKKPEANMSRSNIKNQEHNKELAAKISLLEQQLEQKTAELNSRNKASSSTHVDHRPIFDMYEDLTGVIVTGVKSTETDNLYRCVIAGKHGTFEFSLSISKDKEGLVFYSPTLDQQRDAQLMSILPEFLKEDVEFERENLPTFFWRLSSIIN